MLAILAAALAAAGAAPRAAPRVTVVAAGPEAVFLAHEMTDVAPAIVERAARRLGLPAPENVLVVVAAEAPRTRDAAARLGLADVPYWSAGIAEPFRGRIVLFADRLALAGHEGLPGALAHEAVHIILGGAIPAGTAVPRWYDEGLAMLVERETSLRDAWELARMVVQGDPPPLRALARDWPGSSGGARAAYAEALSFMSFAQDSAAPGAPRRLVQELNAGAGFELAFARAYGADAATLEINWRASLRRRYFVTPLIVAGALANASFGVLALLAAIAARRRRARRLRELEAEEVWSEPDHDEWRNHPL